MDWNKLMGLVLNTIKGLFNKRDVVNKIKMKFQKHLIAVLLIFFGSILIGGYIYSVVEGWRILDSIYFVIMTMTTIGYGDFVPLTDFGKILTMFFSFIGVSMALYLVSLIGRVVFRAKIDKKLSKSREKRKLRQLTRKIKEEVEIEEKKKLKIYEKKLKKRYELKNKK